MTLEKNTDRRSVRYFLHLKNDAILHFVPEIEVKLHDRN